MGKNARHRKAKKLAARRKRPSATLRAARSDDAFVPEGLEMCAGLEIEHMDGRATCSLAGECAVPGGLHHAGVTCSLLPQPCEICKPGHAR